MFKEELKKASTILWNGPLGISEITEFSENTKKIADYISNLKEKFSVICGGDTLAMVKDSHKFTYISTGGGAALEFLAGKKLPGIIALEKNVINFKWDTKRFKNFTKFKIIKCQK